MATTTAPTFLQTIAAAALNAVIAESNANEATLVAWFNTGGADVVALFTSVVKKIPTIGGVAGIVANPIISTVETGVEAYVAAEVAKYSGQELFTLYIGLLQHLLTLV